MELTEKQKEVLTSEGCQLVTGGPGSGKTTISILKAAKLTEELQNTQQKVLFLSFARATVSRVIEAIDEQEAITNVHRQAIEVDTYHSFFWQILKTHGYLKGLPRKLSILTPPDEAIELSTMRLEYPPSSKITKEQREERDSRETELRTALAHEHGKVCFDLFAPIVGDILCESSRIRELVANRYPFIILDEFQDTNQEQWRVVKALGEKSTLIALADPEQRIYDFMGADPERLNHFEDEFMPVKIDLQGDNHRSSGTEIALFGNEILRGRYGQRKYVGISRLKYPIGADPAMTKLVTEIYKARKRLVDAGVKDWSLAILVPTKKLTRVTSDKLNNPPAGMTPIFHHAVVELEAAILGSEVVAFLMQPQNEESFFGFVELVISYFKGKGGAKPTKGSIEEANGLAKNLVEWKEKIAQGKPQRKTSKLTPMFEVFEQVTKTSFMGDPDEDWKAIRALLIAGNCKRLQEIADELRNLRILNRGSQLRAELFEDWKANGAYNNALNIVRQAFVQEHFSMKSKPETGVIVMNMHKSKGKQFDEVIIFEGWPNVSRGQIVANSDRIVRSNEQGAIDDQARQNFRVSVTRGKRQVTILTPEVDPCVLLLNQ
ncbi:ATP-dependent helicase [Kordiimonas sp. SCSIO 12603]|uniref:UvrD-helicase domain-containing protein n=1 Tax=Kordiimonas sp. SCSIO 12603 TaxID=2829596 RepID=UPI0021076E5E|nr:ATP-dependent helicase [Kordiimonas sp. SCSIO 12603]UTW59533.1 ATP-dependent helicase [Kordiimonas sp. SCSIO 12603]